MHSVPKFGDGIAKDWSETGLVTLEIRMGGLRDKQSHCEASVFITLSS